MAGQEDKQEKAVRAKSRATVEYEFDKALKAYNGSLWRMLSVPDEDYISMKVVQRGDADWLAVGERFWETESKLVTFASGDSAWTALVALAARWHQRDAWKVPKPFGRQQE